MARRGNAAAGGNKAPGAQSGLPAGVAPGGRFDPEKARALGVPVTQWRLLQRGQAVPLAERMVQPAEVLGAPRKGLRFVFSGDSAPCPALEQAAQGADLLLCDATYALPEQQEQAAQWGHSTFGQSAALAAKAGVKRLCWCTIPQ